MLNLYAIFHLNLSYSSVEEEARPEVLRRCYGPLLQLAQDLDLPLGLELTGQTLEAAAALDPSWVAQLKALLVAGRCELVGSGYAQLIGPLVPARVNRENLRLGNLAYDALLGVRPRVALVNEQAYAASLLPHYLEAGFEAVVMEWDNPASTHPQWDPAWRYLPGVADGPGVSLPVIWNNSISFQKFQRYAHGELDLPSYLAALRRHDDGSVRALPLYGNDAEVFGFRPGRYGTEPAVVHDEWDRIRVLFESLRSDAGFRFLAPSQVLALRHGLGAAPHLRLESPESPAPVKKQEKYNITRWAVTGRDDLAINAACHRLHDALCQAPTTSDDDWRKLCALWGSDFRTHITTRRWQGYRRRLAAALKRHGAIARPVRRERGVTTLPAGVTVSRQAHLLRVATELVEVTVNTRRGLALDALAFPPVSPLALCGTLHHGYYDDITSAADFYTGHFTLETPGRPKVTDLVPVEPRVRWLSAAGLVAVCARVVTPLGPVEKRVLVSPSRGTVTVEHLFHWPRLPVGSLRLGNVTVMPEAFNPRGLWFGGHLGGTAMETFHLAGRRVQHGEASSFLVSAKQGLGLTSGVAELGDDTRALRVTFDPGETPLLGLVSFRVIRDSYFLRLALSASEMDETSRPRNRTAPWRCALSLAAVAHRPPDP
jgi:hypothetical protein